MKKQKIAFIEVNPPNDRGVYTKCNTFEPYGLECLATVVHNEGHDTYIFQQEGIPNDEFEREILRYSPDIAAFSSRTHDFNPALSLARTLKDKNPIVKTIIGGSHVSSCPESLEQSLKEGLIDFGIKGEADYSFRDLVRTMDNPDLETPGLIFIQNGKLQVNPSERIKNLDELPRTQRIIDRVKTDLGKIMYPPSSNQRGTALLAYSRGCPFGCSYCDSSNIWGNNVRWRSAKSVVDEMQELKEKHKTNTLLFTDLTFNADPHKVHELCDELINRDLGINWYGLSSK